MENKVDDDIKAKKSRLFDLVEVTDEIDWFDKLVFIGILLNYALSVLGTYVDTPEEAMMYSSTYIQLLNYMELGLTIFFTLEVVLRFIAYIIEFSPKHGILGSIKVFFKEPLVIFDILAVSPYYLKMFVGREFYYLKILRIFRLLKMTRFYKELDVLKRAINRKVKLLKSIAIIIIIMLLITSALIYVLESPYQEGLANAGDALWWTIVTLTTVGYGDIYPVTFFGRILASIVALIGIGIIAVPSGIIATGLVEELTDITERHENDENDDI